MTVSRLSLMSPQVEDNARRKAAEKAALADQEKR
jgi:hypothetical protein